MDLNKESSKKHAVARYEGKTKIQAIVKSVFLAVCWICLGLVSEAPGPTLIDLKARTKSSYEEVSTALTGMQVGYLIGDIVGGALVDKFSLYCELMLALSLDLIAGATIAIPWVPRTEFIWILCCVQGIGGGILNTVGMKLLFNMWLDQSASPMHILHGGYGIGSFIIPLIANPFLAVPAPKAASGTMINITVATDSNIQNATTFTAGELLYLKESRIEFAYLIPAVLTVCVSLVFYVYHFCGIQTRNHQRSTHARTQPGSMKLKQMLNPASCTGGDTLYGVQVFVLLFMFYINCEGVEKCGGIFIRSFAIDHFGFSVDDGSYINTSFWISFTVGRYAGFLVARWIPIRILILIESSGLLISALCHALLSGRSATALWIIIQPVGFFIGPLFPSGMGWGNYHVTMTGTAIALLLVGACFGAFAYLKLVGFLYDTYGTQSLLFTLLGCSVILFVNTVLLNVFGQRSGKASTHLEYKDNDICVVNQTVEEENALNVNENNL